jgi:putative integral membrane protein (TIGR02587 family)
VLEEVVRDLGGALLFGVPVVYTMEVWWLGEASNLSTLGVMVLLGALVAGALRWSTIGAIGLPGALLAGLRCAAMSLALAVVLAWLIGELALDDSLAKVLGVAAAIGIPLSLGAALGAVLFRDPGAREGEETDTDDVPVGRDLAAAALGALFVALPVAPTEEVPLVAASIDVWRLAALPIACLAISYAILFASGFLAHRGRARDIDLRTAVWATGASTATGLVVAAALLVAFGMLDTASPPAEVARSIAALAIPAVVGAAAGRLAAA